MSMQTIYQPEGSPCSQNRFFSQLLLMFIALLLAIALVFLQMLPMPRRRKRSASTQEVMLGLNRKDDGDNLELSPLTR